MEPREPAWAEHEKLHLLAEILKAAPVPSHVLLNLIRDFNIQPRWNDLVLPYGRSLRSSQMVYDQLAAQIPPPDYRRPAPSQPLSMYPVTHDVPQKRAHQPEMYQAIQPRPPLQYGSIVSGYSTATSPSEPSTKKRRGRPTNAEIERRKKEAEALGQPLPAPRKSRPSTTPRDPLPVPPGGPLHHAQTPPSASLSAPAQTGAITPRDTQPPEQGTESSSGKKKRKPEPLELEKEWRAPSATESPHVFGSATADQGRSQAYSNLTPYSAPFSSTAKQEAEHMSHVPYGGARTGSPRASLGPESRDVRMEGIEESQPRTTTPHSFKDTVGI